MSLRAAGGIAGFAARYPLVWHVIEAEGAGCDTLNPAAYPAATLRRLSGLSADSANREAFQRLELPGGAPAILRLQLMPDARLIATLAGEYTGRPDLWRAHIDRHVFFWVSADRRDRFLCACMRLRTRGATGPFEMDADPFHASSDVVDAARVTRNHPPASPDVP
jgi:hypothetical protein